MAHTHSSKTLLDVVNLPPLRSLPPSLSLTDPCPLPLHTLIPHNPNFLESNAGPFIPPIFLSISPKARGSDTPDTFHHFDTRSVYMCLFVCACLPHSNPCYYILVAILGHLEILVLLHILLANQP